MRLCFCSLVCFALNLGPVQSADSEPIKPAGVIRLFNGKDLTSLYTWLKDTKHADPKNVFTAHDGLIHVSGQLNGYLATEREYRDYHLTVEYKWGTRTNTGKNVRNSGVMLHAVGPDGGARGVWMSCIECQLAQGCAGDLIVIRGQDGRGKTTPVSLSAEVKLGPDTRPRWKPGGEIKVFTKRQLWWS